MLRPMLLEGRPHWELNFPEEIWPAFEDFRNCLVLVWDHLGLPSPTKAQFEIAHRLQYGVDTVEFSEIVEARGEYPEDVAEYLMYSCGPRNDIIRAFRSLGKSYITAAFTLWKLARNPRDEKILVLSATAGKAKEFVDQVKGLMASMPLVSWLLDGTRESGARRRDQADKFDVVGASLSQSHSMTARGIDGQITGSRATTIIPDDIEIQKNSLTETARATILRKIRSDLAPIGKTEHGQGDILFLGTPQTEESVYNVLVKEMSYTCFCIPVRFPSAEKLRNYLITSESTGEQVNLLARYLLKAHEDGELTHGAVTDDRFTSDELIKLEAGGRAEYALQYMLDTSLSDAERYPLRQKDLMVMALNPFKAPLTCQWGRHSDGINVIRDIPNIGFSGDFLLRPLFIDKEWREYDGKVLYVDPSGRGKDETAWSVVGQLGGTCYLMRLGAVVGDPAVAMGKIAEDAVRYDVHVVEVEPNYGQGMWVAAFMPILRQAYQQAGIKKAVAEGNRAMAKEIAKNAAAGCFVQESEWSHNQKEIRIITGLEPAITAHRLVVDEDLLRSDLRAEDKDGGRDASYSFLHQLTHITRDRGSLKHDDRLEAVWGGVMHFMRSMSIDVGEARDAVMAEEKQRIVDDFIENYNSGFRFLGEGRLRGRRNADGTYNEVTAVKLSM